ncbi:MAG: hypothetical protein ACFFD2_11675, partial [Promethearchaeota archaeon]
EVENLLETFDQPKTTVSEIERNLEIKQGSLIGFEDVNRSILEEYDNVSKQVENFELHLETYKSEMQSCEDRFDVAVKNLEYELVKWQESVNKEFKAILKGLELDGEMRFDETQGVEGAYELNLYVANQVGGSLDQIEEIRLSKGERRRVSVSFEMAILTQSKSPFLVWDEFDQNLGDDHRELLAKMIIKHLPKRKLIAISPSQLVQEYVRIFPIIITVWKNDDQCSMVSPYRYTAEVKKRGDLLDALQEG